MNKIIKTKVGDEINYFVNGEENHGVVAKMNATYVTVFKEDGKFYQVPLDETFFVKDIIVNKAWDDMSMEERTEQLQKARAYSPRLLSKAWNQLPQELQNVITKANTGSDGTDLERSNIDDSLLLDNNTGTQPTGTQPAAKKPTTPAANTPTPPTGTEPKGLGLKKALGQLYELQKRGKLIAPLPKKQTTTPSSQKIMDKKQIKGIKNPSEKFQQQASTPTGAKLVGGETAFSEDGKNFYQLTEQQPKIHGQKTHVSGKGGKERKKPVFGAKKSATQRLLEQLKSDVEQGVYGNVAGRTTNGLSTDTKVDAPNDYEGQSHDGVRTEQFKYEDKKPKVDDDHKTKAGEFVYTDNPQKYKTKSIGVPESQHNTWGIRYATKEDIEKAKKD